MKAPLDRLVSQGVLPDDHWEIVTGERWEHVGVNKEYSRVEIEIVNAS